MYMLNHRAIHGMGSYAFQVTCTRSFLVD